MMNNSYGMENTEPQNKLYDELAKFNWGAFFLNIIWAIPNGALKECWPVVLVMVIVFLLTQIPLLGLIFFIVNICLAIHFGKKGNEWAWYGKKWRSLEDFVKTQKAWGGFAPIGFVALCITIPMIMSFLAFIYAKPYADKLLAKENSILKTAVSRVVSAPTYKTFESGKDIANYLIENKIYSMYALREPEAVFVEKVGPYSVSLAFVKNGKCSLEEKNCYVNYRTKVGNKDPKLQARMYFSDDGLTEYDKKFKK